MRPRGTLLLSRHDVLRLLTLRECIDAVESAFRLYGEGKIPPPRVAGIPSNSGGFHVKLGLLPGEKTYFAAKINANFPDNEQRHGLPTIQGLIILCDGTYGYPLAVIDSIEITKQRTAAASAVAARYCSREDSKTVTICGCGVQARAQLEALRAVRPILNVFAFDIDHLRAEAFVSEFSDTLSATAVDRLGLHTALQRSDICITATPSRHPFLSLSDIPPGAFIAAVGADSEGKSELDPHLLAASTVVVDNLDQCSALGDLRNAIEAGTVSRDDVHAELGQVVAGLKPGRTSRDEIVVFDSTGVALQDVAAAALVYEKACLQHAGMRVEFALNI